MQILKIIWSFFQNQVLTMKWLDKVIGTCLAYLGIDISSKLGSAIQFFLYDVIKITILLCSLIFIISYIQSFFPPERSKKIMGQFKGIKANLISALLGTVTPFCSPMVDIASLILLTSIFGIKIASIYVLLGLIIAVIGGVIIEKMKMEKYIEDFIKNTHLTDAASPTVSTSDRLNYAKEQVKHTFKKVFPYILIGVGIGAFIHNWIPTFWIEKILGHKNYFGVILATVIGIPMYADIFGTIPIAEVLLLKNAQLGTILSFMMAVTTLSFPSMLMLRKAIKPKLLLTFIIICFIGIIIVGYIFNILQTVF